MSLITATATFTGKDQNWEEESTIYWFTLSGADHGTDVEFDDETFGIEESGDETRVLDADGAPLTDSDYTTIAVRKTAVVTDEMRQQ